MWWDIAKEMQSEFEAVKAVVEHELAPAVLLSQDALPDPCCSAVSGGLLSEFRG
jgi:hypothetical protein